MKLVTYIIKNPIFCISTCLCIISMTAAVKGETFSNAKILEVEDLSFIPECVSFKDQVYFEQVNEESQYSEDGLKEYTYDIELFDEGFNEKEKTHFTAEILTATSYAFSELWGPINITSDVIEGSITYPVEKDEFIRRMKSMLYSRIEDRNGELWAFPNSDIRERYYYYETYKTTYPYSYFVWRKDSDRYGNNYTEYSVEYRCEDFGYTGIYDDAREVTNYETGKMFYIHCKSASSGNMGSSIMTQTLFNEDENFEYVIPILKTIDVSYTMNHSKVEGKEVVKSGFKVVNDNGAVVAEVNLPNDLFISEDRNMCAYFFNNKKYLKLTGYKYDDNHHYRSYYSIIYEINSANSSIKIVGEPKRVSVNPTTPLRGAIVTVTLDETVTNLSNVRVISTSGQVMLSQKICPGERELHIDTGRFERGVYIVTVEDGKTVRESSKIIVR